MNENKLKYIADFNKLKDYGFYLEGNTYKRDVGEHKCIAICEINREVIIPKVKKFKNYEELSNIMFFMACDGLLEKVSD